MFSNSLFFSIFFPTRVVMYNCLNIVLYHLLEGNFISSGLFSQENQDVRGFGMLRSLPSTCTWAVPAVWVPGQTWQVIASPQEQWETVVSPTCLGLSHQLWCVSMQRIKWEKQVKQVANGYCGNFSLGCISRLAQEMLGSWGLLQLVADSMHFPAPSWLQLLCCEAQFYMCAGPKDPRGVFLSRIFQCSLIVIAPEPTRYTNGKALYKQIGKIIPVRLIKNI